MPELPEVETMCRGIRCVEGRTIRSVERVPSPRRPVAIRPAIRTMARRLAGQRVVAVERLGKRVVLRIGSGDRLVIEPRMTGLVLIGDPPTREHLRLRITWGERGVPELLFWDARGLGVVTLLSEEQFDELANGGRIGPDALAVSAEELRQRVGRSGTPVKVALLDQSRVAGIGNLYASEMLHEAQIDPRIPSDRLGVVQWRRLHRAMRSVLRQAIRFEGSTLADGTYRNALSQTGSYQNHHRVYDRAGEPCLRCGKRSLIVRMVQAQRSTFWCPRCQTGR